MVGLPIRVLYLDHSSKLSGAELALVRLLGALDRTRVEPIVVLAEHGPLLELLQQRSIEAHVLPLSQELLQVRKDSLGVAGFARQLRSMASIGRYAWQLRCFARARGAELIYSNSLKADFYAALAARMAGLPLVWHIHDRIDALYLPRFAVWLIRRLARYLPVCVVANSASTLATLRLGDRQHSEIIGCGVTREQIERSWLPRRGNPVPQIGIVGRIAGWKGQDIFLRAAALLLGAGFRARFRIAGAAMFGEEAFEEQLRSLTATLEIGDHVEFLGFSNVPEVLRSLDILVHASKTPEPFGQVIVEGMAAGLPVVATDGGGTREIIESGKTGLLVPMGDARALADALALLLSEPLQAQLLAAAARQHALTHFTVERAARQSEALYERLLRPVV